MYSAVYFQKSNSKIHWWEYDEDGNKTHFMDSAPLYYFVKSKNGEYKSIYGDSLKKVEFENYAKMKNSRYTNKDIGRDMFESDVPVENRFILDKWAGQTLNSPPLDIHYVDIEVHSERGFPTPDDADHPITIITVWSTKHHKYFIFAEKPFDTKFLEDPNTGEMKHWVRFFDTEEELLKTFIKFVRKSHPDIMSGWNSNGYDIPYLINRSYKLLSEYQTRKISPINIINPRTKKVKFGGLLKEVKMYEIAGINCVDYLELYKKYTANQQESYKLDYISRVELKEKKLEYDGTLKELYHSDWQKYVEYNVQDVNLLIKLDKKLGYMNLMMNICYNCRVPFQQYATLTKVLDGAFMSRLSADKIILPDVERKEKNEKYIGAYVRDPVVGVHEWVVSYDATSLYPSIMMEHNISPETKIAKLHTYNATIIMDILEGKDVSESEKNSITTTKETCREWADKIRKNSWSIAPNGAVYRHDKRGVVPMFVEEWFNKRKEHKNLKLEAEKVGDHAEASLQHALQYNYKILINSCYGYLGSEYSRLYDEDNAIAITTTGQECLKTTMEKVDAFFMEKWPDNKIGKRLGAKKCDNIVVYGDTDSCYLCVGNILKSINYDWSDMNKTEQMIDTKISPIIVKIIEKAMEQLAQNRMNAPENKIFFKREMISRRAIHISKKRYVAWALNMEGVPIPKDDEHELEVKGIEIVRSSTPELVRDTLKDVVKLIIKTLDPNLVNSRIREIYNQFMNADPFAIAKNSSANNIQKFMDTDGNSIKHTPQHVKGAINYNNILDATGLGDVHEKIYEGDKVKVVYIKPQDHFKHDSISFKNSIPEELNISQHVDYERMWEAVFLKPIKQFYDILKWQMPNYETVDIDDLFVW